MLQKYRFESVTSKVRTKDGKSYSLRQGSELLKLPSSILDWIWGKSWYLVLGDWVVVDCRGYIEERCLEQLDEI